MNETIEFVAAHGIALIALLVFVEQIGLPIPSMPILLAGGALARLGRLDFAAALAVSIGASIVADGIWYEIGRRKGGSVLRLLCKISLEPDSCVRQTENVFARWGTGALVVSKFMPGLNTVAPPMAGVVKMPRYVFFTLDAVSALLHFGLYLALGYLFGNQIEVVVSYASNWGVWLGVLLGMALVAWIGRKWYERRKFLLDHRTARISVGELASRLDAGEQFSIIDLRHAMDFEADPNMIPGAIHLPVEHLERRVGEIPRDREIILYCT
ncbi:MAG: VTT domain-containing protein [Acidobacteria bacterium]|nr:VTT domain-containing protein [Acidobacteriota bacterium]